MKTLILSLAIASTLSLAFSACNSTKNISGSSDSLKVDTTITPALDTAKKADTIKTTPIDTLQIPPEQ